MRAEVARSVALLLGVRDRLLDVVALPDRELETSRMKKNLPVPVSAEACEAVVYEVMIPLRRVIKVDDFVAEVVIAAALAQ